MLSANFLLPPLAGTVAHYLTATVRRVVYRTANIRFSDNSLMTFLESLVTHKNGLLQPKVVGNSGKLAIMMGNWLSRFVYLTTNILEV